MTQPVATAAIVAVAGRRIDAADAKPERFPLRNRHRVRDSIKAILGARPVAVLVSSAACGADLLALDAAAELGVRFRIILPFAVAHFRASSVTDRPGDWGPLFDRLVANASARGDLVVLRNFGDGVNDGADEAYAGTNVAILDEGEGLALASGAYRVAVIAWDGASRGSDDLTRQFRAAAGSRGWTIEDVQTL